jgi:thiosulfate/3-mercaptopyruvate sulfurtransferase
VASVLVTTKWLTEHLDDPSVVVVDLRWREGPPGRGRDQYRAGHIPGAHYLDWSTDLVDPQSPVAFMLAPPERFAAVMHGCGIGDDATVVAYADGRGNGPFRLWWACRVYGHDDVRVLDGGFDKWVAEERPVSTEPPVRRQPRAPWTPRHAPRPVARPRDVLAGRTDPGLVVLDSRPSEQFEGRAVWFEAGQIPADREGIAQTPRGEIRAGHVPWARNIPWSALYREDHTMKSPEELRALFEAVGASPATRVITYCGCGISASALLFAAMRAGIEDATLYDASWEEWGRDPLLPVART